MIYILVIGVFYCTTIIGLRTIYRLVMENIDRCNRRVRILEVGSHFLAVDFNGTRLTANRLTIFNGSPLQIEDFEEVFSPGDILIIHEYTIPGGHINDMEWGTRGIVPNHHSVFWGTVLKNNCGPNRNGYIISTNYSNFECPNNVAYQRQPQFISGLLRVWNSSVGNSVDCFCPNSTFEAAITLERRVRNGMSAHTTRRQTVYIPNNILRLGGYLPPAIPRDHLIGQNGSAVLSFNTTSRPYTYICLHIRFDHIDHPMPPPQMNIPPVIIIAPNFDSSDSEMADVSEDSGLNDNAGEESSEREDST